MRSGDTLVGIAARFDITTEALMQANGMSAATAGNLQVGRVLVIPGVAGPEDQETQTYEVRTGDTLVGIALRFNVTTEALIRINGFSDEQARTIRPGQVIVIPTGSGSGSSQVQPVATPAQATPTRTPTPSASSSTSSVTASGGPLSQDVLSAISVTPFEPGDNSSVAGRVAFRWRSTTTLPEGVLYELVFWKAGQDPVNDGFGLAAPTAEMSVVLDLDLLHVAPGFPLDFGQYEWGLLLVRTEPAYERLEYAGGGFLVTYEPVE
ncbi:MAG: LysM peptidoglycan-binding domain-containing protein [Caldilineaceae bacterium]